MSQTTPDIETGIDPDMGDEATVSYADDGEYTTTFHVRRLNDKKAKVVYYRHNAGLEEYDGRETVPIVPGESIKQVALRLANADPQAAVADAREYWATGSDQPTAELVHYAATLSRDDRIEVPEHDKTLRVHRSLADSSGRSLTECYDPTGARRMLFFRDGCLYVGLGASDMWEDHDSTAPVSNITDVDTDESA